MTNFPEELIRIAATGSSPRTKASIEQTRFPLLDLRDTDDIPERDLLISIAGYGLQRQAGYIPDKRFEKLPEPAPITEKKACNLTAQKHLKLMLNHVHEELLPHWLEAVHEHQQRIPDEMLPPVLDYGSGKLAGQALLRKAIGERGRWLAQQSKNNRWDWIFNEDEQKSVNENPYEAWENYFRRLRQRDPVEALNILQKYWDELDTLMQMALLRAMDSGLNEEDEDFLWNLFEEETTRFTAARWLLQIETSEFSMEARAKISRLIALIPVGHRGQPVVDFTWSPTFAGHAMQIQREDAGELCQILGYEFNPELMLMLLPLSYWYKTYDVTPDILVQAARNSTRPSVFYRIWTNMAIQEGDSDFLFALVMNVERHAGMSLVSHLTQSQLIQAATHWLKDKKGFSLEHNATALLNAITVTWEEELAATFLDNLTEYFRQNTRPLLDTHMRQALKQYARLLPLSVERRFERVLNITKRGELSDSEIEELNGIIDILRFRTDMINAIKSGQDSPEQFTEDTGE